jgi:hypothetical protein
MPGPFRAIPSISIRGPWINPNFLWWTPDRFLIYKYIAESKEQRGENSDFLFLGRTVRADIFGWIFLVKIPHRWQHMSKNVESSVNIINLLSNKYPISMFDIKR